MEEESTVKGRSFQLQKEGITADSEDKPRGMIKRVVGTIVWKILVNP